MGGTRFFTTLGTVRRRENVPIRFVTRGVTSTVIITTHGSCNKGRVISYMVSIRGRVFSIATHGAIISRMVSPCARVSGRSTTLVSAGTVRGNFISVGLSPEGFNHIITRGSGGGFHRNIHRTREKRDLTRFRDRAHRLLATIIRGVSPGANGTVLAVNRGRTALPGTRRIPSRVLRRNSRVGMCIISIGRARHNPHMVLSHARPNLIGHLFRARIPRVFSNAVRVGSMSHRTNSHAGLTIYSTGPRVSPVNTYVNPHNRHMGGVIRRLTNRGVSVMGCDSSPILFISRTLSPTGIASIRVVDRRPGTYGTGIPSTRLSLTVNGGNRGIQLTTGLAN